jgi:hypothetical protein
MHAAHFHSLRPALAALIAGVLAIVIALLIAALAGSVSVTSAGTSAPGAGPLRTAASSAVVGTAKRFSSPFAPLLPSSRLDLTPFQTQHPG